MSANEWYGSFPVNTSKQSNPKDQMSAFSVGGPTPVTVSLSGASHRVL